MRKICMCEAYLGVGLIVILMYACLARASHHAIQLFVGYCFTSNLHAMANGSREFPWRGRKLGLGRKERYKTLEQIFRDRERAIWWHMGWG